MSAASIRFEDFELSPDSFELRHDGRVVDLEPQEFSILAYLVTHANTVVSKEDLLDEIWGHQYVSDSAVSTRIKGIRKALHDDGQQQRLIQTVRGRGFRFIGNFSDEPVRQTAIAVGRDLTNLPSERTPIFGRESLRDRCHRLIREHRLVSLLGIGGSGKTRLAVSVGRAALQEFADGVWFVDLVPTNDLHQVETAIADAVGVAITGADPSNALNEALAGRHMAIVLDNCEHVIKHTAAVVDGLLDGTPEVHILTTSRIPLELGDEVRIPIPALPTEGEDRTSPAVEMFTACANRLGCAVEPQDMEQVRDVCQHLDGLPLAIDLAAAQLRYLSITDLSERLDRRFELLTQQGSSADARKTSLYGILEYTYGLLDDEERHLLGQLAVFPGTFDFDAVDGVTAGRMHTPVATFAGLVDKALLVRTEADGRRWRMLETVRMFVLDLFDESTHQAFRENHANWVMQAFDIPLTDSLFNFAQSWWCIEHFDDLRAGELFFFENEKYDQGAQLLVRQSLAMLQDLGPRAISALTRLELYPEKLTDPLLRTMLHSAGVFFSRGAGALARMAYHSEKAFEIGQSSNEAYIQGLGGFMGTWTRLDDPETASRLDEVEAIDWHTNNASRDAIALFRGYVLAHRGRWEEISALLLPLVERVSKEDHEAITYASSTAVGLWSLSRMFEEPDHASRALDDKDRGHPDDVPIETTSHYMRALTAAAAGRVERVLQSCQSARALQARVQYSYASEVLLPCTVLAHRIGDHARAREWLGYALPVGGTTNLLPLGCARVRSLYPDVEENGASPEQRNALADEAIEWCMAMTSRAADKVDQ